MKTYVQEPYEQESVLAMTLTREPAYVVLDPFSLGFEWLRAVHTSGLGVTSANTVDMPPGTEIPDGPPFELLSAAGRREKWRSAATPVAFMLRGTTDAQALRTRR